MLYLPLLGSHQPPAATPPQFASRVVRQSTVDWLFDSIVRSVSPAHLSYAKQKSQPNHDGTSRLELQKVITIHPESGLKQVRDGWVHEQAKYHASNSLTMSHLNHFFEQTTRKVSLAVVIIVMVDLALIVSKIFHWLPTGTEGFAKTATLWLIFIATVLPTVVAAVGGIRFQSECQRLAERSSVMSRILAGTRFLQDKTNEGTELPPLAGRWSRVDMLPRHIITAKSNPSTDLGSWSEDALLITERIATDLVQETAEWSVLYAKEVLEPG